MLVVAIGDEHDHVPSIAARHETRRLDEPIGDGRAAARSDGVDGAGNGLAIAGGARDRAERLRKRRHDDAIVGAEKVCEPPGRGAHERHSGVHALARVHEQCVGHRQRFGARQVDRLGLVVLEYAKRVGVQTADESTSLVQDRGLEQNARNGGVFDDLERSEVDRV